MTRVQLHVDIIQKSHELGYKGKEIPLWGSNLRAFKALELNGGTVALFINPVTIPIRLFLLHPKYDLHGDSI